MAIVTEDGSITVNIVAERGETLDLMRRHIDQLAQAFRGLGYDTVNFSFGQTGADDGQQADQGAAPHQEIASEGNDTADLPDQHGGAPQVPASSPDTSGVDIRL